MAKLTALDKLLLYLKLPGGRPADVVDPLRQPLNPLGSRDGDMDIVDKHGHCTLLTCMTIEDC